ncbi:Imm1 family immunity protein [Actinokineospora terrae]|uniref:Immunity protein Imm1 n=1 Tax=Actinokineospora terrae TaxID=155974 RepID=A0A1H9M848_9PSEU|nr:Imm1 family immunity protein [Actinokineospora terrae]SER19649.1 Immunity protein Imm1 [Actinokineospora terrae]
MTLLAHYSPDDADGVVLATERDVDAFIERLHRDSLRYRARLLAQLYVEDDDSDTAPEIGLGIDHHQALLSYSGHGFDGIWVSTDGNGRPADEHELTFDFMGNLTEFPAHALLPLDRIRIALYDLLATNGQRPTTLDWAPLA